MARVTLVKKARKDPGPCGGCRKELKKGDPYRWYQFRFQPKRVRCMDSDCTPSRSDLTQSEIKGTAYGLADRKVEGDNLTALSDFRDGIVEDIENDLIGMIDEKLDNIEAGMGHAESPVYADLEERRDELEGWKDEIECIEPDEDLPDEDQVADPDHYEETWCAYFDALADALANCPE